MLRPCVAKAKAMDMRNFFGQPVSKARHAVNIAVADVNDFEKREREAIDLQARVEESKVAQALKVQDRVLKRLAARVAKGAILSDVEQIYHEIDNLDVEAVEPDVVKKQKKWTRRPENWLDIVDESKLFGIRNAFKTFKEEFCDVTENIAIRRIKEWRKDDKSKKVDPLQYKTRAPSYGSEIDKLVYEDFLKARQAGIAVDDDQLRRYLVVRLKEKGKLGLLRSEGGVHDYGHAWVMRFCKRWNLPARVTTTKMREIPADYAVKKATYIRIAANIIHRYNVPKELVIGGDETAVQFVSRAKRTRNVKGAKKVRAIGMGSDKAQITKVNC
jgi:hypothetical protein